MWDPLNLSATSARHQRIGSPGQWHILARTKLPAHQKQYVGAAWKALDLIAIQEVAGDGVDAAVGKQVLRLLTSEPRRRENAAWPAGWSDARRARRAREGPILPPAPSTSTSPSRPRMKSQSASVGSDSSFSRAATEVMWGCLIQIPGRQSQTGGRPGRDQASARDTFAERAAPHESPPIPAKRSTR